MRSSVDDRPLLEAVDEGVPTLTLHRPEHRNALDAAPHSEHRERELNGR